MNSAPTPTAISTIDAESALTARGVVAIDLRSPSEFQEDHLPGALNLPLFDDAERALIGTLYHRASPQEAFDAARSAARQRIETLVAHVGLACGWSPPPIDLTATLDEMTRGGMTEMETLLVDEPARELPERPVVLYCWRGGLRSKSVVALLRRIGLTRALLVRGGYKSYRKCVIERIETWRAPRSFVLRGLTGVGKTLVLRELERIRPRLTIDLEGLAQHRSSILGRVGLEPVSQKAFESRLAARLVEGCGAAVVFEGESRKVGDAIIPENVWKALDCGVSLELVAPLERRVSVLLDDYLAHPSSRLQLAPQLGFIEQRLGKHEWTGVLVDLLRAGREAELARILLEQYYDPLYRHSEKGRSYVTRFDASDPARCAAAIATWIDAHTA